MEAQNETPVRSSGSPVISAPPVPTQNTAALPARSTLPSGTPPGSRPNIYHSHHLYPPLSAPAPSARCAPKRPRTLGRVAGTVPESEEEIARWVEERKRRYPTGDRRAEAAQDAAAAATTNEPTADSQRQKGPAAGKRRICSYYRRGSCRNGTRCRFEHEAAGRPTDAPRRTKSLLEGLDGDAGGERRTQLLSVFRLLADRKFILGL